MDLSLDASPATVTRAAQDAVGYPNMTWGVPLSDAEAAEIQRRIQVMESLLPAIHGRTRRRGSGDGGRWVTGAVIDVYGGLTLGLADPI